MVTVIFVPKHLVILIIVYQTNTAHRASNLYSEFNMQNKILSDVELVTLLTFCTNFQVFARFVLQSRP